MKENILLIFIVVLLAGDFLCELVLNEIVEGRDVFEWSSSARLSKDEGSSDAASDMVSKSSVANVLR